MMRIIGLNKALMRSAIIMASLFSAVVMAKPQQVNVPVNKLLNEGLQVKNFNCKSIGASTNQIEWQAVMGASIKYFAIERSSDGVKFDSIIGIYVLDSSGKDSIANFSYRDETADQKLSYYRIKQVLLSGEISFTKALKVESISNEIDVKIFPNSSAGDVYVHIPAGIKDAGVINLKVLDLFGRVAFESKIEYYEEVMEISFELNKGYYNMAIEAGDIQFSKPITIH